MGNFWNPADSARGYDDRWQKLAADGENIHGEADLAEELLRESGGTTVLDAGCGTGRVAIELAGRGFSVVGVDSEAGMLATARAKAPDLTWVEADLADLGANIDTTFDLILLAGNVMIFLAPGTEDSVVHALASQLKPGGLLVSGFSILPDRLSLSDYDRYAEAAGLTLAARWSTWNRDPFTQGDYAVSVHRRPV